MLTIGSFIFDGFEALDFAGPLSVLLKSSVVASQEVTFLLVAERNDRPIRSSQMFSLNAHHTFDTCPKLDILLLPGGIGTLNQVYNPSHLAFLRKCAETVKFIASVCTGSAAFAAAGLITNKPATTNKASWNLITNLPSSTSTLWQPNARFVQSGNILTSSGVSAGIDMGFHLAAQVFGDNVVAAVAQQLNYTPMPADNDPFAKLINESTGLDVANRLRIMALPYVCGYVVEDELYRQATPTLSSSAIFPFSMFGSKKPVVVIVVPADFEVLDLGAAAEVFACEPSTVKTEFVTFTGSLKVLGGRKSVDMVVKPITPQELLEMTPDCVVYLGSEIDGNMNEVAEVVGKVAIGGGRTRCVVVGEAGRRACEVVDGREWLECVPSGMGVATACLRALAKLRGDEVAKKVAKYTELWTTDF
ncbi:class I glutamine amidotransferase-like protein [Chytridium lagenaria]|nr:class I glutamine amidotransferase-like protein [Chytridium lagenaria]